MAEPFSGWRTGRATKRRAAAGKKPYNHRGQGETSGGHDPRQKPDNATHWSTRTMAAAAGVSAASVRRIWHAHGLKPHLVRRFKVSNDPHFADKLETSV